MSLSLVIFTVYVPGKTRGPKAAPQDAVAAGGTLGGLSRVTWSMRQEDLDLQVPEDVAFLLEVGDHRVAGGIGSDERGVAVRPSARSGDALNGGPCLHEHCRAGERLGRQRAQWGDVVDDPDAPAMRRDDQVVIARMDREIAH